MKKPLSIKEPGGLDRWWSVVDANNEIVCVGIENKPTALEIVRCVNAHEALVGALEESIQYSPYKGESEETPFLRRARAAIAKARGNQ